MNARYLPGLLILALMVCPLRAASVMDLRTKDDAWFSSEEGKRTINNILTHQRPSGGWRKAYDISKPAAAGETSGGSWDATIDNGATYTELRALARSYTAGPQPKVLDAFNKGLDFLIELQYDNGGWPQRWPIPKDYGRYVTFNDDAMTNVMTLLQDIAQGAKPFAFVDEARRGKAKQAFDKGMDLILKAQIKNPQGELTAWAQQYDEKTLQPALARSYELPGISGSESAGIMMLLMRQENPTPAQKQAIHAGAQWFEKSKITGKRLDRGGDWLPMDDPSAGPLWSRYYEIESNRPFFADRDGVKVYELEKVGLERRKGYAWLRPWGEKVLAEYENWKAKHG